MDNCLDNVFQQENGNSLVSDRSQSQKGRSVSGKMLYPSCFKFPYAYRMKWKVGLLVE
jgi:hypothetical protein